MKSPLEIELSKFIVDKNYRYPLITIGLSIGIGILVYYLLSKENERNLEIGDPGREIIFESLLSPRIRYMKAKLFLFCETNLLFRFNTLANKKLDDRLGYEKYKLQYLKHLQLKYFNKNKNDLFEFLEAGEDFIDKLK